MPRELSKAEELKAAVQRATSSLHQAQYEATLTYINAHRVKHANVVAQANAELAKAEATHAAAPARIERCKRAVDRATQEHLEHIARRDVTRLESVAAELLKLAKANGKTAEEVLNELLK